MEELRFDARAAGRVRFAVSPLWEVTNAIRVLRDPEPRAYHLPWLEAVRPALEQVDLALLLAVQPVRGYTPDFLAPLPDTSRVRVADQLAAVRATPLEVVRRELRRTAEERFTEPAPALLNQLARRPKVARERLAAGLDTAWRLLVAPHWKRVQGLLSADIAHHGAVLAAGGLQSLMPALSAQTRWTGRDVQVRHLHEGSAPRRPVRRIRLDARGLVLVPSAFSWPRAQVVWEPPWQPALYYPARGIAELWQPAPGATAEALFRLLGRTRAVLLLSLREPATTTTLAHRHGLAAATVSEHLSVLAGAGLVASTRVGKSVRYGVTDLGARLLVPELSGRGSAPAP